MAGAFHGLLGRGICIEPRFELSEKWTFAFVAITWFLNIITRVTPTSQKLGPYCAPWCTTQVDGAQDSSVPLQRCAM